MTRIIWDPLARDFLLKLQKHVASRIIAKLETIISNGVPRYLEDIVGNKAKKIRIGDFRLFVDYDVKEDFLVVRAIRQRRNVYK